MAVNESRSMRQELLEGATDGSYKSTEANRGGEVEQPDARQLTSFYESLTMPLASRDQPGGNFVKQRGGRAAARVQY
jgi:hypothetical protein